MEKSNYRPVFFHANPGLVFPLIAVLMYFIGFVVVICVISEAAGKPVERQKGKAVVIQTEADGKTASFMHQQCTITTFRCRQICLFRMQPVF